MRCLVVLSLLLCLSAGSGIAQHAQKKTEDCYCTDSSGSRVELGQLICLQVDGRLFMARCEMSLNVPMWREQQSGCSTSSLPQLSQPTVDAG
nr:hypothetical protein [Actibacterium sp. 188UL27-1]